MSAHRDDSGWQDHSRGNDREDLLAPSTQIVSDREAYLGQGRHDVGRRISNDQVELFASTDVASALQMEFTQHAPRYIAVHDVGTSASLRLLSSIAGAADKRVQKLSIRRQGHGMALAVLQFVEVDLADGTPVRVYASDISADGSTRLALAKVLLAHSSLGVLLMGSLSQAALSAQLQPLRDALHAGPWPNRELLMVPLGSGLALASHAAHLCEHSSVAVHVTPTAAKTRQAWAYIGGAWNRLHGSLDGEHTLPTEFGSAATATPPSPPSPPAQVPRSEAPTEPMGLNHYVRQQAEAQPSPASAAAHAWKLYADSCCLLKGVQACCVFDTHSLQVMAHAGPAGTRQPLAEQGVRLLRAMNEATRAFGLGTAPLDGSLTAGNHHLILRPVPEHPGVAVHLLLSSATNLTLAKMQLDRVMLPR